MKVFIALLPYCVYRLGHLGLVGVVLRLGVVAGDGLCLIFYPIRAGVEIGDYLGLSPVFCILRGRGGYLCACLAGLCGVG